MAISLQCRVHGLIDHPFVCTRLGTAVRVLYTDLAYSVEDKLNYRRDSARRQSLRRWRSLMLVS